MSRKKRLLFGVVVSLAVFLLLEGACSFVWLAVDFARRQATLPKAGRFEEESHAQYDAEIGWVHRPNTALRNFYGPGRHLHINSEGFRANGETPSREEKARRVICLGDSFTLGFGVDDRDTWPAQWERLTPDIRTVNMGQGGYSVGQCCLWYRRSGPALKADALVFAFIVDDIWRMRGERMANGYGKPRFSAAAGRLTVSGQPVPTKIETGRPLRETAEEIRFLADHNSIARTLRAVSGGASTVPAGEEAAEQVLVLLAVLDELSEAARSERIPFLVVLLPELREFQDASLKQARRAVSEAVSEHLRGRRVPLLDLFDAFVEGGADRYSHYFLEERWHHYNEAGNRLVAERVDAALRKLPDLKTQDTRAERRP